MTIVGIVVVNDILGGCVDIVPAGPKACKARKLLGTKDVLRKGVVRSRLLNVTLGKGKGCRPCVGQQGSFETGGFAFGGRRKLRNIVVRDAHQTLTRHFPILAARPILIIRHIRLARWHGTYNRKFVAYLLPIRLGKCIPLRHKVRMRVNLQTVLFVAHNFARQGTSSGRTTGGNVEKGHLTDLVEARALFFASLHDHDFGHVVADFSFVYRFSSVEITVGSDAKVIFRRVLFNHSNNNLIRIFGVIKDATNRIGTSLAVSKARNPNKDCTISIRCWRDWRFS
mmetsp:Transcript_933/g.1533  ORF Transcript_933/g.1533 Transcript_933/m.1533 type:complete len:283 (-) Transcript_933:101-949(-)